MEKASMQGFEVLSREVDGRIVLPDDSTYEETRKIWNGMIDKRPAIFVQCSSAEDVAPAIRFARRNNLEVAVRGAGHNIAGSALCDAGLVIDFSRMRGVTVLPAERKALVQPGATLHDFDAAAQEHGLATPIGINSTTGIAGLTLGGGFGWLTRKYGLTVDKLISADIVTADGRSLRASEEENSDLLWAIRGGGGNFGVVTRFEFRLHPVGPEILAGLFVFPFEQAHQVLTRYREFVSDLPEELTVWVVLRQAPPLPFLPESVHGKEVVVFPAFYTGDPDEGNKLLESVRSFGDLHGEHVGVQPYSAWQQAFDPLLTAGARNYWKSHNFVELSDGALDTIVEAAAGLPSSQCEIFIGLIGGAPNRVSPAATAYAHRDARFVLNVHSRWDDMADDNSCIKWARDFFQASAPYASAGAYVNFMTADETDRISAAFGSNYGRLVELKRKYDPENVFHINQN